MNTITSPQKDHLFTNEVQLLFDVFKKANVRLRLVGGCVRDTLLNRPLSDIDLSVDVEPQKTISILNDHHFLLIPTGFQFGTVTAVINEKEIEITSLRKDIHNDGRHAVVAYTSDWQLDALRRDFTINALSVDQDGQIYDYVGGLEDLKNKHLRFIGDPNFRIEEDFLRILRYFRFLSQLHFTDPDTYYVEGVIRSHLKGLRRLSKERVRHELYKLLCSSKPSKSLLKMNELKVLQTLELNFSHLGELDAFYSSFQEKGLTATFSDLLFILNGMNDSKALKDTLCLTRKEVSELKTLKAIWKEESPDYLIYVFGKDAFLKKQAISQVLGDTVPKTVFVNENLACPLSGKTLEELKIPPQKRSFILDKALRYWLAHQQSPSQEELIEMVKKGSFSND